MSGIQNDLAGKTPKPRTADAEIDGQIKSDDAAADSVATLSRFAAECEADVQSMGVDCELRYGREVDIPDPNRAAALLATLKRVRDVVGEFDELLRKMSSRLEERAIELFIETQTDKVTVAGRTVYLAQEYWPTAKWSDLATAGPDGQISKEEKAAAMEAAKRRLRDALADTDFSSLVEETVNASRLRSALTGEGAERDRDGNPILPEPLRDVVDLNPRRVVRVLKAK